MKEEGRGASPDGLRAKPLLIGSVRDSEQVEERAISSLPLHLCLALFCFVNSWLLICISIHVLFMAFWSKISQDRPTVVCKHKECLPWACVDGLAISKPILRRRLTLMQPKEMNDLCDCHFEGAEQPRVYIPHHSLSFPTACRVFFF